MSAYAPPLPKKAGHEVRSRWAKELAIQGVEASSIRRQAKEDGLQRERQRLGESTGLGVIGGFYQTPALQRTAAGDELEPPPRASQSYGLAASADVGPVKVAIVGAGSAGLFTGMIFDYLNQQAGSKGFQVNYDILEAASTAGGRLFTYNFKSGVNGVDDGSHQYYDVGAMRFPDNDIMARLFDLFNILGMERQPTLDSSTPVGCLVPYYMKNNPDTKDSKGGKEFFRFNDKTHFGDLAFINTQDPTCDPFLMNDDEQIPNGILANKPDDVINQAIDVFRTKLGRNDPDAWSTLMSYDGVSTRTYLGGEALQPSEGEKNAPAPSIPPQPYNWQTINWLETFNGGTNWYDQAHSETVLESMDFDFPTTGKPVEWWCVLGGANVIAQKMQSKLSVQPQFGVRVTGITSRGIMDMEVCTKPAVGGQQSAPQRYAGVFNSTSLGCMREMNIDANLNYSTKQAMRTLGYGPSAKVGILFDTPWWIHGLGDYSIKQGGLGHSDLNIRTCVYPSYNCYLPEDQPAVLICSYNWQQDAERLGSLMAGVNSPDLLTHKQIVTDEAQLKDLVLRDLARMHTGNAGNEISEETLYTLLQRSYIDHYAHDWTHDPNTAGAFAFFRPQQFSALWPRLVQPSDDLVIVGEAASPHHAWVVGALESAVHGVYTWLQMNAHKISGAEAALEILGTPVKGVPFVGLPDYMPVSTAQWQGVMGRLAKEDHQMAKALRKLAQEKEKVKGGKVTLPPPI